MFPRIHTDDGLELANHRILIGVRLDANVAGLCILDEPSPATSLDASKSGVELCLHAVQAAEGVVDGFGQRSRRRLAAACALGRQVLPEQAVIDVAAAMEVKEG